MQYICHRDYNGIATSGNTMDIKHGETFEVIANYIATNNGEAICRIGSEVANKYFARNDDNNGLERGKLTWEIAYANRDGNNGYRFTDKEQELIANKYRHFLKPCDAIIFNRDFFAADIDVLQKMLNELNQVKNEIQEEEA